MATDVRIKCPVCRGCFSGDMVKTHGGKLMCLGCAIEAEDADKAVVLKQRKKEFDRLMQRF